MSENKSEIKASFAQSFHYSLSEWDKANIVPIICNNLYNQTNKH